MLLNIALLVIGTTATLAAFGGRTWGEGDEPILKRVTRRGWVSLACLLAALAIGVVKETRASNAAEKAEANRLAVQDQLDNATARLASLGGDLKEARVSLRESDSKIQSLQDSVSTLTVDLQGSRDALADANYKLEHLRENSENQPVIRAAPAPRLQGGKPSTLSYMPYAGSKLEVFGFDCPLSVRVGDGSHYEVPAGESRSIPVIGFTGQRYKVQVRNADPIKFFRETPGSPSIEESCSGKIMVHSTPFLERGFGWQ